MSRGGESLPGGDFRGRLRRLRRDPLRPATGPERVELEPLESADGEDDGPADRAGMPAWLRARLARAGARPRTEHARTEGPPRDLVEACGPRGAFAFRRTLIDAAAPHGDWRLGEVHRADREALGLLAGDAGVAAIEPRSAVYLDIETTGLSGGAGTTPFLVCLGRFTGPGPAGGFELWQGFLREPDEEPAMLHEVARRVAESSGVVSFFGKAFDRHRLEDKMRLHGVAPPFAERPHLDLYHLCRRLYRPAFDDGRLQTMERGLCGVVREHDLSGAHAPAAWYDFLTGRPHLCEAVFTHNLLDVLSLVTLHAHLGRTLAEQRATGEPLDAGSREAAPGTARSRAVSLARLFERRREHERALDWCERARARGARDREQDFLRAHCLARTGASEAAAEAFRALGVVRDPLAARALFEAARLAPGPEERALLERAGRLARLFDPRLAARIEKRLARLPG